MSTTTKHDIYNRERFPILVCRHGYWDIYRDESGSCAAIPSESGEAAGCKATHFGPMWYVRQVLAKELLEFQDEQGMADYRGHKAHVFPVEAKAAGGGTERG